MALFKSLVFLTMLSGIAAVSPIEKVITLISDMKSEVETEGKDEAAAYDKFACFCKDTTDKKVTSVNKQHDKINVLSADIADKTQSKKDKATDLAKRQQAQEADAKELEETNVRCSKEQAEYEAEAADLSKAIQGLKDAIKAMKDSKPASFIAVKQLLSKRVLVSLLQKSGVDPSDPEYDYHSGDIIDVCADLLTDYKAEKKGLDDEYKKSSAACDETKASLKLKMKENKAAMNQLGKDISRLGAEIAEHRTDLVEADGQLKDDEQYLKDLTQRCQDRANDYDQRSAMRGGEINALAAALEVLSGKVKGRADQVNDRAFVQKSQAATLKSVSLLQELSKSSNTFLSRSELTQEAKKGAALALIQKEGQRLGSLALMTLSSRVSADPFQKVKGLIQKLIERLLTESKNEATKKGFCDTEMAKAESSRDSRWTEANDLSADLAKLEAKEDALVEEIKELKSDIGDETAALKESTEDREDEKKANMETLKVAKEGLAAVNEAILILKSFYKQAAKASFLQASPVDEDTAGAGFSGNYKGSQGKSNAVFALLETIASDFDRTIRTTEEAEHNAHREFVEFDQTSKMSLGSKTTKKELNTEDLKTTRTLLKTKTQDMQTAVDLLDKALEELEDLKPTCVDTGMSYAERVAKREEEIKALEKALTILS